MEPLDRIIALIKNRKIPEAEFALSLSLNRNAVNDWKSGKSKSYMKHIDRIAEYFGVSTDYLLCKTDNPSPASPSPFGELTSEEVQAVKAFLEAFRREKGR